MRKDKRFYKDLKPYNSGSEIWNSIPYKTTTDFGFIKIPLSVKLKIFSKYPNYTLEEILGTYAGANPIFSLYDYDKDYDLIQKIRYELDPKGYYFD